METLYVAGTVNLDANNVVEEKNKKFKKCPAIYRRSLQDHAKRGGIAPPVKTLTAQLHHAVFHSCFVMFDGKLFVFHAQAIT